MNSVDTLCVDDLTISDATNSVERDVVDFDPSTTPLDTTAVIELLLKGQRGLDQLLRDETSQRALIPRLLAVAIAGFAIYGVTMTAILNLMHSSSGFWLPFTPAAYWNRASLANLTIAYSLGLIAANGICLPSFYFYGLLAGVRITMIGIVAQALRGMAAGAIALVGILPIFVAMALNIAIFGRNSGLLSLYALVGLSLPFIGGIWGAICLYRGFIATCDTIPESRRKTRTCMLRRLVLAWSGCYTFVTPLVIYSLWHHLAEVLH